jgi:hypothetical protein
LRFSQVLTWVKMILCGSKINMGVLNKSHKDFNSHRGAGIRVT